MKIIKGQNSVTLELRNNDVNIYFSHKDFGFDYLGGINWTTSGTKGVKETKEFIRTLQKAIKIYEKRSV